MRRPKECYNSAACDTRHTLAGPQVMTIPPQSTLHEVTRHMDHVRKLTLFRQSHDTSPGAVLNLVRASAAFRNVAGMTLDRGDHGGGDDVSPTAGGLASDTAARLRRGPGRASVGFDRQMSSPGRSSGAHLSRASTPLLSPFLSRGATAVPTVLHKSRHRPRRAVCGAVSPVGTVWCSAQRMGHRTRHTPPGKGPAVSAASGLVMAWSWCRRAIRDQLPPQPRVPADPDHVARPLLKSSIAPSSQ